MLGASQSAKTKSVMLIKSRAGLGLMTGLTYDGAVCTRVKQQRPAADQSDRRHVVRGRAALELHAHGSFYFSGAFETRFCREA